MESSETIYTWDFLRKWCTACLETYFSSGRDNAREMSRQLKWKYLKLTDASAQAVVLSITDLLNEGKGLVYTEEEEKKLFEQWNNVLLSGICPEETLRTFRSIEEQINS
jgi:hypothetical protein